MTLVHLLHLLSKTIWGFYFANTIAGITVMLVLATSSACTKTAPKKVSDIAKVMIIVSFNIVTLQHFIDL